MSEIASQELRTLAPAPRPGFRHRRWLDVGIDLLVLTILWLSPTHSLVWFTYLALWTVAATTTGLYSEGAGLGLLARGAAMVRTSIVWSLLAAAVSYVAPPLGADRFTLTLYLVELLAGLLAVRVVHRLLLRFGLILPKERNALIIGDANVAQSLGRQLTSRYGWVGRRIVGTCPPGRLLVGELEGRFERPLITLLEQIREKAADEVLVVADDCGDELVRDIVEGLRWRGVRVSVIPRLCSQVSAHKETELIAGTPVVTFTNAVLTRSQRSRKRQIDFLLAAPLSMILTPVMALIALAIKLDSRGPALFVQERVGEGGRNFRILKFRTMYQNADAELQRMIRMVDGKPVHKFRNDPRVTRVGRWLRSTSLDELPQLINVLRGEMSLVGPRPELPWIVEKYEPWQFPRLAVPPGITGWWQLNGRGERPMHLSIEHDLFYIERYSLFLDLKLLCRTLLVPFYRGGAF